jgi:hypothetical protein
MADERQNQYLLLAMVGIVAVVGIVALVVTFAGGTARTATPVITYDETMATEPANTAGDVINPTPRGADLTPRIAYWSGKVNQHVDIRTGAWMTDPDGRSGATINMLTYCKKWYPATTSVVPYRLETITTWRNAGNTGGPFTSTKQSYQCVAGAPIRCYKDSDCGTPTTTKSCSNSSACTKTTSYTCVSPGTTGSFCSAGGSTGCMPCAYGCGNGTCLAGGEYNLVVSDIFATTQDQMPLDNYFNTSVGRVSVGLKVMNTGDEPVYINSRGLLFTMSITGWGTIENYPCAYLNYTLYPGQELPCNSYQIWTFDYPGFYNVSGTIDSNDAYMNEDDTDNSRTEYFNIYA